MNNCSSCNLALSKVLEHFLTLCHVSAEQWWSKTRNVYLLTDDKRCRGRWNMPNLSQPELGALPTWSPDTCTLFIMPQNKMNFQVVRGERTERLSKDVDKAPSRPPQEVQRLRVPHALDAWAPLPLCSPQQPQQAGAPHQPGIQVKQEMKKLSEGVLYRDRLKGGQCVLHCAVFCLFACEVFRQPSLLERSSPNFKRHQCEHCESANQRCTAANKEQDLRVEGKAALVAE